MILQVSLQNIFVLYYFKFPKILSFGHDFHFLKDALIASFSCLFNQVSVFPVLLDS